MLSRDPIPISGDVPIISIYLLHIQHCVDEGPPNLLRRLDKCGMLRERDVASWWLAALSKITKVGSRCLFQSSHLSSFDKNQDHENEHDKIVRAVLHSCDVFWSGSIL